MPDAGGNPTSSARAVHARQALPRAANALGGPDLQGNFTNKYEQNTRFERPADFDGRGVEDNKGRELAALSAERAAHLRQ